jgi:hypothetical protein
MNLISAPRTKRHCKWYINYCNIIFQGICSNRGRGNVSICFDLYFLLNARTNVRNLNCWYLLPIQYTKCECTLVWLTVLCMFVVPCRDEGLLLRNNFTESISMQKCHTSSSDYIFYLVLIWRTKTNYINQSVFH